MGMNYHHHMQSIAQEAMRSQYLQRIEVLEACPRPLQSAKRPGYAVGMKESYVNMQLLLDSINYNRHQWVICGDLKVIAILLGMQLGYTKFAAFSVSWILEHGLT